MKKALFITSLGFFLIFSTAAVACPAGHSEVSGECSLSSKNCASKDYLEASEAEIALLGKQSFHANIALVEKALLERGVKLPQNGFITSEFRSALMAYQESVGLAATGEINQATLDKLKVKF